MDSTRQGAAFTGMKKGTLHLWCAYPDDLLDAGTAETCAALLSEDERARWQRFRFAHSRREFLATHALARAVLSRQCEVAPEELCFVTNRYGKPCLEPDCGVRFNLSNSTGLVVCLAAEGDREVGVDVEPYTRAEQIAKVGHRVFSAAERAQLDLLSDGERLVRYVWLWTLKEAYLKARGVGMSLPLGEISFRFDSDGGVRLELGAALGDDAGRWGIRTLDHAGYRIAVVAEGAGEGELEMWEARPPLAAPRRVFAQSVLRKH